MKSINKKGFTLVELLSVLILLIVLVTIAILNLMPTLDKSKKKAFIDEAYVMSEGVMNKYNDDRIAKNYSSDMFHGRNATRKCYPIKTLIGKYVNKNDDDYHGSIEVCSSDDCTYTTKLWLTDGEYYLNGVAVNDELTFNDIDDGSLTDYFDSCGIDLSLSSSDEAWFFDYIGYEQVFIVPEDGTYALRSWGAQGGNRGGKGGYAYTEVDLKAGDILYVNVGAAGTYKTYSQTATVEGGYNSGGSSNYNYGGGGGATYITLKPGSLSGMDLKDILEVAGGGGGGADAGNNATNGGGHCNSNSSVCFESGNYGRVDIIGAGGGIYTSKTCSSCGGSGYIGNPITKNGEMYVLSGPSNSNTTFKTLSTSKYSATPLPGFAKEGYGYAIISKVDYEIDIPEFNYTGGMQTYRVPQTGKYKLEVWGAQGGAGGSGGYSYGEIDLVKDQILYVYVGGQGTYSTFSAAAGAGGFNGGGAGGRASSDWAGGAGGGGATHIATEPGLLSELSNKIDSILIVAGGGGGGYIGLGLGDGNYGGSGGGFKGSTGIGVKSYGGSQTSGYAFGQGAPGLNLYYGNGGSGGGFYGGFTDQEAGGERTGGSGGSGYIGNPNLTNKGMYCNSCEESSNTSTRTTKTNSQQSDPTSLSPKLGHGYAKITFIE